MLVVKAMKGKRDLEQIVRDQLENGLRADRELTEFMLGMLLHDRTPEGVQDAQKRALSVVVCESYCKLFAELPGFKAFADPRHIMSVALTCYEEVEIGQMMAAGNHSPRTKQ